MSHVGIHNRKPTLDNVACQKTSSAKWNNKSAVQNISSQLKEEVVASVLLVQLAWVSHVKFNSEEQRATYKMIENVKFEL